VLARHPPKVAATKADRQINNNVFMWNLLLIKFHSNPVNNQKPSKISLSLGFR
jgi:hypothetical protein